MNKLTTGIGIVLLLTLGIFLMSCGGKPDSSGVLGENGVLGPAGAVAEDAIGPGKQTVHSPEDVIQIENSGQLVTQTFDFSDFEMADADKLIGQYPQHEKIIRKLTR